MQLTGGQRLGPYEIQRTTEGDVWLLSFEPSPASPGAP